MHKQAVQLMSVFGGWATFPFLLVQSCCASDVAFVKLRELACRVHQPLRQCLGWVLLHAGRLDKAAAVYKQVSTEVQPLAHRPAAYHGCGLLGGLWLFMPACASSTQLAVT
jgi:hypothetical protein